jgi:hypothetical protein
MEFDELANLVISCAVKVHRKLGPGLLESTYEQGVGTPYFPPVRFFPGCRGAHRRRERTPQQH